MKRNVRKFLKSFLLFSENADLDAIENNTDDDVLIFATF